MERTFEHPHSGVSATEEIRAQGEIREMRLGSCRLQSFLGSIVNEHVITYPSLTIDPKATLPTEYTGQAFICVTAAYFTKAAEFAPIPEKSADTMARVVHDYWFMRYGMPAWVTTASGTEFAGAFRHQLERFGIDHV